MPITKAERLAQTNEWRRQDKLKNPEKYAAKRRARTEKDRAAPDYSHKRWTSLIRVKYNLSLEEYNNMFAIQRGCCAICGTHQSEMKIRLSVDHDHTTGKIRSLLCKSCNIGLGEFKDRVELLKKAISYLESHV
jgi:hypothetical protein